MLVLLCVGALCVPAAAEAGSLTVTWPIEGTEFYIHRVGTIQGEDIVLDSRFEDLDTSDLASAAGIMAERVDSADALAAGKVSGGSARFSGLERGVYLVTGNDGMLDGIHYWPTPFLLSIPQKDESGASVWNVEVDSKKELDVDITVAKKWVGDTAASRPGSIRVYLMLDGKDYGDPVTLSAANGWSYTWHRLPPKAWSVREDYYPQYLTYISRSGNTFTITNTWKTIPQTGQLWWPVTALAGVGMVLLAAGMLRRKKGNPDA